MENTALVDTSQLRPCFDTTVDVVTFCLQRPMDYVLEKQKVTYTKDGLQYESQMNYSSSSSD